MHNLHITMAPPMQVERSRSIVRHLPCDFGPTDPMRVVPANFISLRNFDTDRKFVDEAHLVTTVTQISTNQLGNLKILWVIIENGFSGVWVRRVRL